MNLYNMVRQCMGDNPLTLACGLSSRQGRQ